MELLWLLAFKATAYGINPFSQDGMILPIRSKISKVFRKLFLLPEPFMCCVMTAFINSTSSHYLLQDRIDNLRPIASAKKLADFPFTWGCYIMTQQRPP